MFVGAWLAFKPITKAAEKQQDICMLLSEELIDNNYDNGGRGARLARRNITSEDIGLTGTDRSARCGDGVHLVPMKQRWMNMKGERSKYSAQGTCRVCRKKSTHVCSACADDGTICRNTWICHPKTMQF